MLDGWLTHAISCGIIERDIVPAFRSGVVAGTAALIGALSGAPDAGAQGGATALAHLEALLLWRV